VLAFGPKAQVVLEKYLQDSEPDRPLFHIRRNTYSNIVRAACKRAGISPFVPHELRHTSATLIRDRFCTDAAQAVLGHSKPDMTAHYTSQTIALTVATAEKMG
jgi:Phage integrase family